jgi:nucleotide-binding universal stress UspA family protein
MDNYRILVATDFSPISDDALARAVELARLRSSAEIHVVHVIENLHHEPERLDSAIRRMEEDLAAVSARLVARTFVHIRVGAPAIEIVKLAADLHADVITVGTHGRRGFSRMWMGMVAERVLRLASCPVLVARPTSYAAEDVAVPIEPPCPGCIIARTRTEGRQWWCDAHSASSETAHRYTYSSAFDHETSEYNKVW